MKKNCLVLILIILLAALANTACPPPNKDAEGKQAPPDKTLPAPVKETSEDQTKIVVPPPPTRDEADPARIAGFPWEPFPGSKLITIDEAQQYAGKERPRNSLNQEKFLIPQLALAATNPKLEMFELYYVDKPVSEVFEFYASKGLHDPQFDEDYHKWNHWMTQTTLEKRKEAGIDPWWIDTAILVDLGGEATLINLWRVGDQVLENLDGSTKVHIPPTRDVPLEEADEDAGGEEQPAATESGEDAE